MFDFLAGKGSDWLKTPEDMAQFLEREFGLWEHRSNHNEWDDFENLEFRNPALERERKKIVAELSWANGPLSEQRRSEAILQATSLIAHLRSLNSVPTHD